MRRNPVQDGIQPVITTYTGRIVNVLDPRPSDVDIRDILHGLSGCGRFVNQTDFTINVGQHSAYVARLVEEDCGMVVAAQGLLHDASEAYIGDMPKWLKNDPEMKAYREAEDRWWWAISKAFKLPRKMHPAVKEADALMVRFEARRGFRERWTCPPGYPDPTRMELDAIRCCFEEPWRPWGRNRTKEIFRFEARRLGFRGV